MVELTRVGNRDRNYAKMAEVVQTMLLIQSKNEYAHVIKIYIGVFMSADIME